MAIRKIDLMHREFGKCEGHACRECNNLVKGRYRDKILTKCKVYGMTHSQASDWAGRYQACGMFNKPWDKKPIIRLVTRDKIEEEGPKPLDGQLMMEV